MNKIKSTVMIALFALLLAGTTSCDDNLVYEKEGDCSTKVQFIFKKHRQALHQVPGRETDAFYSTVGRVSLFVYDLESGKLVFEKSEQTENLLSATDLKIGSGTDRCYMDLDLAPGKYRMVAWCGLDESGQNNAFHLMGDASGSFSHCGVKLAGTGLPFHEDRYDALYHGVVKEVEVRVNARDAQIIPIELTKNTNDINIWVQHTSQTFEDGDYEVVYTDANGTMHFEDNSMTSGDRLEYHSHATSLLNSDTEYNGNIVKTGALISHLSTGRLMKGHGEDARLEVRDREGKTVFSVPFIKYVLEMQTFVNESGTRADDRDYQYYLDCEDTYNCTFYLSGDRQEDGLWMPAMIIINNWVMVPKQNQGI